MPGSPTPSLWLPGWLSGSRRPAPAAEGSPVVGSVVHALGTGDAVTASTIITVGYLVDTPAFDVAALDEALGRVVMGWHLLQGRLVWSKESALWTVVIPPPIAAGEDLPLPYPPFYTHTLTVSTELNPISPPLSKLPSDRTAFLPERPVSLFRHPSAPNSNAEYASRSCPLLTAHVHQFSDAAAVGLSFPHGVFDGIGMGKILQALRAELKGVSWDASPLAPSPTNALLDAEARVLPSDGDVELGRAQMRDFVLSTFCSFAWMVAMLLYEKVWQRSEMRVLWLGEDVVKRLVQRTKKEAEVESGGGWVSTGDCLLAWFLKASLSDEATSSKLVASSTVFDRRALLGVPDYPHNSTSIFPLPLVSLSTLARTPLSTLALLHRHALASHRTLSSASSLTAFVRSLGPGSTLAFARPTAHASFIFTNQSAAGFGISPFDWMGAVREVVVLQSPFTPDHSIQINRLPGGGYMLGGSLRRTRWKAIEREARRLEGHPLDPWPST